MAKREIVKIDTSVLFHLIKKAGWSRATFAADKMNRSRTWCSEWIKIPPKNLPSPEEAARICAIFGVKPETFVVGNEDIKKVQALIDLERDAQNASKFPSALMEGISNVIPMPHVIDKPLVGTIACGTPILATENVGEYVKIPDFIHCDFALLCKGDSMIGARIFDGDIVCVRQQDMVENGEIAAVLINDEATLKRVYISDEYITLTPENPAYEPLIYVGESMNEVRILGKATHFISSVK